MATKRGLIWGTAAAASAGLLTAGVLRRRWKAADGQVITRGVTVNRPVEEVRELLPDPDVLSRELVRPGRVTIREAPADWGTEISVEVHRGQDDRLVRTVLRQVKSVIECGQVLSTKDDPADRGPMAESITSAIRDRLGTGGRP